MRRAVSQLLLVLSLRRANLSRRTTVFVPFPKQEFLWCALSYTTTKETIYSDQTRDLFNTLPTKLNTLLSPLLYLMQATKKKSEICPSNQVSVAAMISASDEKWRPFNCFFSPGNRW